MRTIGIGTGGGGGGCLGVPFGLVGAAASGGVRDRDKDDAVLALATTRALVGVRDRSEASDTTALALVGVCVRSAASGLVP